MGKRPAVSLNTELVNTPCSGGEDGGGAVDDATWILNTDGLSTVVLWTIGLMAI